jgi:hypothetical protein
MMIFLRNYMNLSTKYWQFLPLLLSYKFSLNFYLLAVLVVSFLLTSRLIIYISYVGTGLPEEIKCPIGIILFGLLKDFFYFYFFF